jgi:uncharacterized protein
VSTASEELGAEQCRQLLQDHHFGRLAFMDQVGVMPMIIPVNYVSHGAVVVRSDEGRKLRAAAHGSPAAFEIDGVDDVWRTGWSVVVRGPCRSGHC